MELYNAICNLRKNNYFCLPLPHTILKDNISEEWINKLMFVSQTLSMVHNVQNNTIIYKIQCT